MKTSKRILFLNIVLFLLIGGAIAFYIFTNIIFVRDFAEKSFINDEKIKTAVNESRAEIEGVGGQLSSNYTQFADNVTGRGYYMIVTINNSETYWTLDSSMRSNDFHKAFKRSRKLSGTGMVINNNVMIYRLQDPIDNNIVYHIIDLDYPMIKQYELLQSIYLVSLLSYTLITIIIIAAYQMGETIKPLKQLSAATHELRIGNLDYVINTNYKDEIAQVYKDFDALRVTLKEAKAERERLERDREEYIAGITHDLKTPLTSILGFSKGLIDGVANEKEKTEKYLKIIYETALSMNSLIEKLKEFSRLDSEKQEFNFVKVNVVDLIDEFVDKNAMKYHAQEVTLTSKKSTPLISQQTSDNDFMAMIDIEEFRRVLFNIINNTVKYKHKGMASSEIIVSRGYGQIIISIKDDGPGVNEKELEDIFNCFYRGDISRTRPTEGSGLGLYVAAKIIAAHNGTIKAVNDRGLKIIITIPEVKK